MKKAVLGLCLLLSAMMNVFSQPLRIAVTTDMQDAGRAFQNDFKTKTGIESEIISGSPAELATKIRNGASYDVILTTDIGTLRALHRDKLGAVKPTVYAVDGLIVTARGNVDIKKWQQLIMSDNVSRIVMPDPDVNPYGRAAKQALTAVGLWDRVSGKIFYDKSLAQVNEYIGTGAADVGFTAESLVRNRSGAGWAKPDSRSYEEIEHGMILVARSHKDNYDKALKFYNYLLSPEAREVIERSGYRVP